MQLTLDIPDDIAAQLRTSHGPDLGRAALERFALESYRARSLSRYQLQRLLGFDNRWDTEEWLGKMGEHETYTLQDLEDDRRTLEELIPS